MHEGNIKFATNIFDQQVYAAQVPAIGGPFSLY